MAAAELLGAMAAWATWSTPAKLLREIRESGPDALRVATEGLPAGERARLETMAEELAEAGVGVLVLGSEGYPEVLAKLTAPPAILAYRGNIELLDQAGIAVCGARSASEAGIAAARRVGELAASRGLAIIAGNAAGVDATAQRAALDAGGSVVAVLPEGIARALSEPAGDAPDGEGDRVVALSQFPFTQGWTVWGAMARNAVIVASGVALIVIEAGEQGGTRAAGEEGLRQGRPVLVLDFEGGMPAGNRALAERGATVVRSPAELMVALDDAAGRPKPDPSLQLALPL